MNLAPLKLLSDSPSIRLKQFTPDILMEIDPITVGLAPHVQMLHCPNGTTRYEPKTCRGQTVKVKSRETDVSHRSNHNIKDVT